VFDHVIPYRQQGNVFCSVADPGCLSQIQLFSIPDPNFFHPGSASKYLSTYFTQKMVSKL
jgi:hypothetical protein